MFTIQIILKKTDKGSFKMSWKHVEKRVDMRYQSNKNEDPCGTDNRKQGKVVAVRNQSEQNCQRNGMNYSWQKPTLPKQFQ